MKTKIVEKIRKNLIAIGTITATISSLIAFILLLSPYFYAEELYYRSTILEDIPEKATYNSNLENETFYWKNTALQSISVPSADFFKTEKMDSIGFVVIHEDKNYRNENASGRFISTVFIRGIINDDLPFVYDYKREIDLDENYPGYPRIYNFNGFSITETAPWTLSIEYKKESLWLVIITTFVVSCFIGFGFGIIFLWVLLFVILLDAYYSQKRKDEVEMH